MPRLKDADLVSFALDRSKLWDFPPSQWEENLCLELKTLDVWIVPRAAPELLAERGMLQFECHANVKKYVEQDPSRKSRIVTGWWVQWPTFLLHSVVGLGSRLTCITPSPFGETEIYFIPESKIKWVKGRNEYSFIRNGRNVEVGVRAHPRFTMAQNAIVRERILAGVDPLVAGNFTQDELDDLIRRYAS